MTAAADDHLLDLEANDAEIMQLEEELASTRGQLAFTTGQHRATEERLRQVEAQLQQSTTTSRMREQRAIETALFQSNGPWIVVSNLEQDMPPVEKETLAGQIAPTLQAQ